MQYQTIALSTLMLFVGLLSFNITPVEAANKGNGNGPPSDVQERIDDRRAEIEERRQDAFDRACARLEDIKERLPAWAQARINFPPFCEGRIGDPPMVALTADPEVITEGESSTLEWETDGADTCTAMADPANGFDGDKPLNGDEDVSPTETTEYTLTCENERGETSDSVTVEVEPLPEETTITLQKTVINDDGGEAVEGDFQAQLSGGDVPWDVAQVVAPGTYTASESVVDGYTAGDWGGDCSADGTVTVAEGEDATCTITNNDEPGELVVVKELINDNDGTATTSDFSFTVNGGAPVAFESDGENVLTVDAGTYTIEEPVVAGYSASFNNCTDVDIGNGESATCTITNNDNAPTTATLTLVKEVVNDDGGSAGTGDWTLSASGPSVIAGQSGSADVTDAEVDPGTYTLSESNGPSGYSASDYSCVVNDGEPVESNSLELEAGDTATCTIENDDQPGTLRVVKNLINDDGGTATTSDFSFMVDDGEPVAFEADGQNDIVVDAGTYSVTEVAAEGYTTSRENCTDVVVENGGEATCTITNDDIEQEVEPADHVLISEVFYDVDDAHGQETDHEWIELHNPTASEVDVSGWMIAGDAIPATTTIPAGGYIVLTATSTLGDFWTLPGGVEVIDMGGPLTSFGLGNDGDAVVLTDDTAAEVDAMSYGDDTSVFDPAAPDVAEGNSLAREPVTTDSNTAAEWTERETPTPGE